MWDQLDVQAMSGDDSTGAVEPVRVPVLDGKKGWRLEGAFPRVRPRSVDSRIHWHPGHEGTRDLMGFAVDLLPSKAD